MAKVEKKVAKKEVKMEPIETDNPLKAPIQIIIAAAVLFLLALWLVIPSSVTHMLLLAAVGASSFLLLFLSFKDLAGFQKNPLNILSFFFGLGVLLALLYSAEDMLLAALIAPYLLASLLFTSKIIKLQTAIIICLVVTAILFRVYPAMLGDGPMPGNLISMDDPYYHYKFTQDLYENGNIAPMDYRVYPPDGRPAPHVFSYYLTVYLTFLTGQSLQSIIVLYPVIMSAFGAVMIFFLLKELTGDWKSGALGGFFFATMGMLLTKSMAGAIEEDLMGMVLGIFSIYLLVKALKSNGSSVLKFAVFSGVAFFITSLSWGGVQFLLLVPVLALLVYFYLAAIFRQEIWEATKAVFFVALIFLASKVVLIDKFAFSNSMMYALPLGLTVLIGVWAENIRTRLPVHALNKALLIIGFIGIIVLYYSLFLESASALSAPEAQVGIFLILGAILLTSLLTLKQKETRSKKAKTHGLEELVKQNLPIICTIFTALAIFGAFVIGLDDIAELPNKMFEKFAGISTKNFLVDKTISEQAALVSGNIWDKLDFGYSRYGLGEPLTILMAAVLLILIIYYLTKKDYSKLLDTSLLYLFGLMFFLIAMKFVWVEARLGFSQSLGFLMLGAMVGLLLPNDKKELTSLKIIPLLLLVVLLPLTTFSLSSPSWEGTKQSAGVDPSWFLGVKWLDQHIAPGQFAGNNYINGDYVFTWWDYGHFITALSRSTTVTDPTQADEGYIMRTARFFYNTTSEDEAIAWLMQQPWNINLKTKYIILDNTLVSKASALAFLGTNYYEYPNGETAVNGVCSQGQVCQNVENGLVAKEVNGDYTCDQGVVCTRDNLISIYPKKCCEATPTKCCNMTLDWRVAFAKGGTARILRSPGTAVYGTYQIMPQERYACRPEYTTKLYGQSPLRVVENGEVKEVVKSYLYSGYSGLKYNDGGDYPAFVIFTYSNGEQKVKFISSDCKTKDYAEVMASGKDLLINLGYGVRLTESVSAPQIFIHVPQKWMNSMFTKLYLQDAEGLKYIHIIKDNETDKFYPTVKVYKIDYPSEVPVVNPNAAKLGDVVEVDYTGMFENGTVFDTSKGKDPLKFTLGGNAIIQGFENAVIGMEVGQNKVVTISPGEAYGFGSHPLANKTLVFNITLVSINKEETPITQGTTNGSDINMTFDYYDPKLKDTYKITNYPSLVWNCELNRLGTVSGGISELDALKTITCIANKGEPSGSCRQFGVTYDSNNNTILVNPQVTALLKTVKKTSVVPCAPNKNESLIQAFFSQDCQECLQEKQVLDQLEADFAGYIKVDYYCVGDATYCKAHSLKVVS